MRESYDIILSGSDLLKELVCPPCVTSVQCPSKGTSLLQEVVYLVSQGADPDEIGLMNIDEQLPVLEYPQPGLDIIQELTSPRLIKSHLPYRFLPTALHNGESKMIYMARNPKDLVVSYYQFHRSLRTMSYRGTFQEFCRRFMNDKLGYGSWFEHVQEFWEHRMDSNVLFLKYEDMYKDLATLVEQLARFLGVSCDKAQLETMVENCHQLIEQCSNSEALSICRVGYGSWFEHVQEFWEHRMDSNVLFLKYEDMYKDLATLVEQLARFLGVSCDKAQLETMVENCHQLIEQCSNSEALSICRGTGTSVRSTPDPSLSMVDIECILQDDLRSAFQVYDAECNLTVTKGEFRSVVESFLIPLTEGQFEELLAKVSKNLKNTVRAFRLFDYNRDGRIQKHKFRRVIKSYCFQMTNKEFSKLCQSCKDSLTSGVFYRQFLDNLGIVVQPGDLTDVSTQVFEGSHQREEMRQADLTGRCTAMYFDPKVLDDRGLITDDEQFQILTDKLGFKQGEISYSDFLMKFEDHQVGSPGAALQHTSNHRVNGTKTHFLSAEQCLIQFGNKLHENFTDLYCAFYKADRNRDGIITMHDFRELIDSFMLIIKQKEFLRMLGILGLGPASTLNYPEFFDMFQGLIDKLAYFDFLRVIDDGRASKYGSTQVPIAEVESEISIYQKALEDIKKKVTASFDNLQKGFAAIDKKMSGALKQEEFRRVLDSFCFRFSDPLFTYLLSKIKLSKDNTVDWIDFMQSYSLLNHKSTNECLEKVQKASKPLTAKVLSMTDILTRIHEVVSSRLETITKEIKDIDYAQINVISKEDFRKISNQYFMRLTDEQFENFWNRMAVNDYGNLEYREFLKRFSGDPCEKPQSPAVTDRRPGSSLKASPPASAGLLERSTFLCSRPETAPSVFSRSKSMVQVNRPFTAGEHSTPLLNCESIEQKVKRQVCQSWKKIYKQCRERDAEGRGEISVSDFLAVMEKYETKMTPDEFEQLALKYNIKNNGKFSYPEFLQHFVLTLKPQDGSLLQRMKISQPRKAMSPGNQSSQFVDAMLTIQGQVLQCWKPMRHHFKGVSGYVSLDDFRQVLRKYSVNLSEDDFFHLTAFYDKNLNGKISYMIS
ncbi:UNVERIFIED_CONTAM: hypothetical protein FKN15_075548 [Acipenser sinensis]